MVVDLLDRRLLFVTGKGGVGKTTIAAALALLAASQGKRTLVCEVDAKGNLGDRVRDRAGSSSSPARSQPDLWAMAMDTEESLQEYLNLQLKLPLVGRIGPLARTLRLRRQRRARREGDPHRRQARAGRCASGHYDLVVVDAAATGHIVGQLAAPARRSASSCRSAWCATRPSGCSTSSTTRRSTGVVIVTHPEEMPVTETIELVGRLRAETNVDLAAVVVNRVLPELFGAARRRCSTRCASPSAEAVLVERGRRPARRRCSTPPSSR